MPAGPTGTAARSHRFVSAHRLQDGVLESMTQQLLQISSVFLVQQSELQQVRDRLTKELGRVNGIAEALTFAAQQHQDAVSAR